jgi:flagellar motor switch protein FliG
MADLNELEKRIQRIEEQLGIQNRHRYGFEELVDFLDRKTFEMIWVGVDAYNIAVSLIGLTDEQLKKVKGTFSKTRWAEITNEYQGPFMQEITEFSIRVNREVILDKIHRLESRGEIVLGCEPDYQGEGVPWTGIKDKQGPFVDVKGWVQSVFNLT